MPRPLLSSSGAKTVGVSNGLTVVCAGIVGTFQHKTIPQALPMAISPPAQLLLLGQIKVALTAVEGGVILGLAMAAPTVPIPSSPRLNARSRRNARRRRKLDPPMSRM